MAKGVRMADIAEKLGISIVSVSKALAGKDGVSEEMRAKILSTAEELGYRSPAAKATATQQTGGQIIGVLVADHFFNENTFYSNLYRAILQHSAPQGISVAMEEQRAKDGSVSGEAITAVKTGLMGPLAGIGDTLNQAVYVHCCAERPAVPAA